MYKINYKWFFLSFGSAFILAFIGVYATINSMKEKDFFIIIALIMLFIGVVRNIFLIKKFFDMKYLSTHGELLTHLSYIQKPAFTPTFANGVFGALYYVQVNYKTNNGKTIKLKSRKLFTHELISKNKTIKLLIDPNNPKRYYIDFNIEKID